MASTVDASGPTSDHQSSGLSVTATFREKVVIRAGLDPETVLYTIRHSFISNQLLGGVPVALIAQETGTSLAMIDKSYAHFAGGDVRKRLAEGEFKFETPTSTVVALKK